MIKDMISIVFEALIENEIVLEKVTRNRISYYEYPEEKDESKPFIVITPLHPPRPGVSASDVELTTVHTFQVDVQGRNRKEVKVIQSEIKSVMQSMGYAQLPEGLDEYFGDVGRFVDGRRYRANTKLYDTNY